MHTTLLHSLRQLVCNPLGGILTLYWSRNPACISPLLGRIFKSLFPTSHCYNIIPWTLAHAGEFSSKARHLRLEWWGARIRAFMLWIKSEATFPHNDTHLCETTFYQVSVLQSASILSDPTGHKCPPERALMQRFTPQPMRLRILRKLLQCFSPVHASIEFSVRPVTL